ncbi:MULTISPECIES: hypothetical protein [Enterococcus]|uniref:hypothetical protein n=1 Tax=Enterococcus TaxID=1350 RepID=UPI0010F4C51D|nr:MULTISPECIES: hypothetical protein [Enterococcus]KAF1300138.1 hypothetical protein BAU16_12900 [Enterococcus sp. JM9B]
MENQVRCMTFKELKEVLQQLEADPTVNDETKIFLDTGWDSLQEILPGAITRQEAQQFQVEDPLSKELFNGYASLAKAEKMKASGETETVIVIENLY